MSGVRAIVFAIRSRAPGFLTVRIGRTVENHWLTVEAAMPAAIFYDPTANGFGQKV